MKNQFKERNHFYIRVGKEYVIPLLLILHDHENFTEIQFHELVTVVQGILKNHFSKIRYSFYSTYLTSEQSSTSKPLYLKDIGFTFRFATTYPKYAVIIKNDLHSIQQNDLKRREEEKKKNQQPEKKQRHQSLDKSNNIVLIQDDQEDNNNSISNNNIDDNNIIQQNNNNSSNSSIQIDLDDEKEKDSDGDYEEDEDEENEDEEEIEKEFKLPSKSKKKNTSTKRKSSNSRKGTTKKKESIKIDYNKQSELSDPSEIIETKFDIKQQNEENDSLNITSTTTTSTITTTTAPINIDDENNKEDESTTETDIYQGGYYHGLIVTGHTLIVQTQNKIEGTSRPIDLFYFNSDEEDDGFTLPDSESQLSSTSPSGSKRVRKTTTTTTTSNNSRRKTKTTIATGNNSISTYFYTTECSVINKTSTEIYCEYKNDMKNQDPNVLAFIYYYNYFDQISLNLDVSFNQVIECSNGCDIYQYCNTTIGGSCLDCPRDRQGASCSIVLCSLNKGDNNCNENGKCNTKTGECECEKEFTGEFCNRELGASTAVIVIVIVVSIVGALVLGIIGVFLFLKLCPNKLNQLNNDDNNNHSNSNDNNPPTKLRKIYRTSSKLPKTTSSITISSNNENDNLELQSDNLEIEIDSSLNNNTTSSVNTNITNNI